MSKYVKALLSAIAAFGAVLAAVAYAQSKRRADQAKNEADDIKMIEGNTHKAKQAATKAKIHKKAAEDVKKRAQAKIKKLATQDPSMEELVKKWNG